MGGVHQFLGDIALEARQADIEPRLQEIGAVRGAEIDLGIDRMAGGQGDLRLGGGKPIAPMKQADQPAANSCSGLVPAPDEPGEDSLMSSRLSELRAAPSRPPVVWVLPV